MLRELSHLFTHPVQRLAETKEYHETLTDEERRCASAKLGLRNYNRVISLACWTLLYFLLAHIFTLPPRPYPEGIDGDLLRWADGIMCVYSVVVLLLLASMQNKPARAYLGICHSYYLTFSLYMTLQIVLCGIHQENPLLLTLVSGVLLLLIPVISVLPRLVCFLPLFSAYVVFSVLNSTPVSEIVLMSWFFALVFLNSTLVYIAYYSDAVRSLTSEQNTAILRAQLQQQVEHYQKMEQQRASIATYRHDMRNHLIGISALLQNGQTQEAVDYITRISDNLNTNERVLDSGNPILDAVITAKRATAQSDGITFRTDIHIFPGLHLDPMDVCRIFGNVLDNAIEACLQSVDAKPFIAVSMEMRGKSTLVVKIENTASRKPVYDNGKLVSQKKDSANHGYGLKSAGNCIEKYGGGFETFWKDNVFTLGFFLQDMK